MISRLRTFTASLAVFLLASAVFTSVPVLCAQEETAVPVEGAAADTQGAPEETAAQTASSEAPSAAADLPLVKKPGRDACIPQGYYYLQPACSKTRVLGVAGKSKRVSAKVRLSTLTSADYQTFYIEPDGSGLYTIRNKNSGLFLEMQPNSTGTNFQVVQAAASASNAQKWYITLKKKDQYLIQSAVSKTVLTVDGSKDKNKQNVSLSSYKKKKGQRWSLVRFKKPDGRWKKSARIWKGSKADYRILGNIIGAIESGEQIYGNLNYGSYDPPYKNSPNEHTITLGWPQCYGPEAQELLKAIFDKDNAAFREIDQVLPKRKRIENYINKNITAMHWRPTAKQKKVIIKLLESEAGRDCQDAQFKRYMQTFVRDCRKTYTRNAWAVVMYCEIRHLGGKNGADRIFRKCGGDYSLRKIMSVLKQDQRDSRSNYQVGDKIFWSRHECVCTFLETFMA